MRRIYKYAVVPGEFSITAPVGAKPLRAMAQGDGGEPQLWMIVDPAAPPMTYRFRSYGTGHDILDIEGLAYVDTFMLEGGSLVFHLFEVLPNEGTGEEKGNG